MQLKSQVSLNGPSQRYSLVFLPVSCFCLTNVVLLSMAFLGTYVQNFSIFFDSVADIDVVYACISQWLRFWTWYKFHPPKHKTKPVPNKASKRQARQLLKMLMLASAALPSMGPVQQHYLSKKGTENPEKIITSTTHLSAFNLMELKSRLSTSPLFSLFKGLITPKI